MMKIYKNNWSSKECYFVERNRANGRSYGVGLIHDFTPREKDKWIVRTDYSYHQSDVDDPFQFTVVGSINLDKIISEAVAKEVEKNHFTKHHREEKHHA